MFGIGFMELVVVAVVVLMFVGPRRFARPDAAVWATFRAGAAHECGGEGDL